MERPRKAIHQLKTTTVSLHGWMGTAIHELLKWEHYQQEELQALEKAIS